MRCGAPSTAISRYGEWRERLHRGGPRVPGLLPQGRCHARLPRLRPGPARPPGGPPGARKPPPTADGACRLTPHNSAPAEARKIREAFRELAGGEWGKPDRKSVVEGKSVDLGGRRI